MWLADGWKDYEVIDSSDGEKLERWGQYILVRPDPQVIWDTPRTDKRWKHPNRARTTSEKPTDNRGADRADIDFGHQTAATTVRPYAEGSAAAYSMQRSRILNRMVQGFLLGADRVHSRIRAESRCKLAWLLLILTFSAGFSIDCGWCKPDDSTAQIADWFA